MTPSELKRESIVRRSLNSFKRELDKERAVPALLIGVGKDGPVVCVADSVTDAEAAKLADIVATLLRETK